MDRAHADRLAAATTFKRRLARDLDPFARALLDGGLPVPELRVLLAWFWAFAADEQLKRWAEDDDDD